MALAACVRGPDADATFDETPLPASAFNDSVGVNTHLNYSGTIYDTGYAAWAPVLVNSRIEHLRDQFCIWGTASAFCTKTWASRWNRLAAAGIRFDVISNPWMGWTRDTTGCHGTCFSGYAAALGLRPGSIEAYEGPNECDFSHYSGCTSYGTSPKPPAYILENWSPLLWTLASPSIAIYGPAMAFPVGYVRFADPSQYMNFAAIHNYTKPRMPETSNSCCSLETWQNSVPSKQLVTTETGFETDTAQTPSQAVSELAQERYTPRILFWQLEHGIDRTYLYELIDLGGNSGGFGLLRHNGAPKPAWIRLLQLMDYFADERTSPRRPIAYSVTGDTADAFNHVLFQRSTGEYLLAMWLATPLWNEITHADVAPRREDITVMLPAVPTSVQLTQFNDNGRVQRFHEHSTGRTLTVPVTSLISILSFRIGSR
jgi:hypothetical protein